MVIRPSTHRRSIASGSVFSTPAIALASLALVLSPVVLAATGSTNSAAPTTSSAAPLSLNQLQQRAAAQGVQLEELEIKGALLKVEGYNQSGQEVDLTLDRRTGEVLDKHLDDPNDRPHHRVSIKKPSGQFLSLDQLQQHVAAQGIQLRELSLKGKVAKIEGYDNRHRKVDMTLDRTTGKVLYQGFDD
ncbi:MAG: PepSY domain-containing protein [Sinobacteraceae bacterium]|nr:PepSY domain-containing protein [Nevskiaceae bacterium]